MKRRNALIDSFRPESIKAKGITAIIFSAIPTSGTATACLARISVSLSARKNG